MGSFQMVVHFAGTIKVPFVDSITIIAINLIFGEFPFTVAPDI